jgi:regulator of extracellular matrix RemA (YlzA/DUF370 family)
VFRKWLIRPKYIIDDWMIIMSIKLINIGFGNIVSANRIISIVSPESAPIKRIIQDARDRGSLIDATYGRRTRAVIVMDSDHVILSAVQPETVAHRLADRDEIRIIENAGKRIAYRIFWSIWCRKRNS